MLLYSFLPQLWQKTRERRSRLIQRFPRLGRCSSAGFFVMILQLFARFAMRRAHFGAAFFAAAPLSVQLARIFRPVRPKACHYI